ncbi:MAG TPA: PKD domain-containing protein, partial [Flavisolibacter sp.]|nr:PKD domain-containing protein [Flavisolibacter sp.]
MITKTTILTLLASFCAFVIHAQTPTANFTASTTSGCSPLVVDFTDQSTGNPTSWLWDFGNGGTSTLKNPSTTYFKEGVYTITLTATNAAGSHTFTRTSYITIYGKPSVYFIASDSVGCYPFRIRFTDLSTASSGTTNTSWLWDFGNGVQSSLQNPANVYSTAGANTVTLKVTNDKGCYSVYAKPRYIQINGGIQSGFTNTQPTVCRPPFDVSFSGSSTGPGTLSYYWDFGDGSTSTAQSPSHTYTTPGNYTVSLATTSTNGCSDTLQKASVLNLENVVTKFDIPDSICLNAPNTFLNTSTPKPQTSLWSFGDGTSSDSLSPVKVFTSAGTYTVKLLNTYAFCTDSATRDIKVLPRPSAAFTSGPTTQCQPNFTVNFQDQSTNVVAWLWNFGDGSTATVQNPSHTYTQYGDFDVVLVVTNASGCTDTLPQKEYVKIHKPVITFPGLPQRGCVPYIAGFTATIETLDAVTSYLWDFGDGATSTAVNPTHVYPIQGTYTVTLTITTSGGCTETLAMPGGIKVGTKPTAQFTFSPNPVCAFKPVQFTDQTSNPAADQWYWSFGDGTSSTAQNPLHDYADTGKLTIYLVATNNGCEDTSDRQQITVLPPVSKYSYTTDCNNRFQVTYKDESIGADSWFWNFGDGQTSTLQNPVHNYSGPGTYLVSLTVTNSTTGCSHTKTEEVKVIREAADFTATFTTACKTAFIGFAATSSNLANIVDFKWDFGNGQVYNSSVQFATGAYFNSGYYTVSLITTDLNGCKDTVPPKVNYIRINGPTADFSSTSNQGCAGLKTSFTDLSKDDGLKKIVAWKWDFGDGTIQNYTSGPFEHIYKEAGTYTVKLYVTDAGGCIDSMVKTSFVQTSAPKAGFYTFGYKTCPGSLVNFVDTSHADGYTTFWTIGTLGTSTQQNPTQVFTDTGFYSIQLKITDQYGCSDSVNKIDYVEVRRPYASFTVSDSISSCTPFEVHFTNTSTYYSEVLWDLGGGTSNMADPIQFYSTPGTYQTKLLITSFGGCQDSAFHTIQVYDTVGSRITYRPLDGCTPLLVDLDAFSPGPARFTWDFGDGNIEKNDTTALNHVYHSFGNFIPKIIMTDPSGCVIPVTGLDTIKIIGAVAKFGLDKRLFCDSGYVSFIDSTTYNDTLTAYQWDFGDGTTSTLQNPGHQYTAPGFYSVSLNVQTENACRGTYNLDDVIKIVQSPLISIGGDSVVCLNGFMNHLGVFDRSDTSAVRWQWKIPNGNSSTLQNPVPQQYTSAGSFQLATIVTNSSGCSDTATRNLLVNPLPAITIPTPVTMQAGFPVTLPATYSSNVVSYAWTPGATLSCTDCPQPTASPKFNTKYQVAVVDSNGCRNVGEVQVIVICKNANVFVPNTFSPNGDGSNDVFYVRGRGLERVKTLRIFNRWGEVVFEQNNFPVNDASYGWNGKYKGNKPTPDVYIYQVEVFCDNSEIIRFEGNVALI